MEKKGNRIILTFDHVGGGLDTFDVRQPIGFAIAGKDRKFSWAQANIIGKDRVEVWSEKVQDPVAVRYAWADNPVCNLQNREGLPATPFRTDDWPGVTADRN
jgi:sialate O-acetylesterase